MGSEIEFGFWFAVVIIVISIAGAVGEYLNDLPQVLDRWRAKGKMNGMRETEAASTAHDGMNSKTTETVTRP